jgi:hypothetical protein
MKSRKGANDFQMAQLFGADVHQQIFASGVIAVKSLDRILHRGSQLSILSAKLLQQHAAKLGIWLIDTNGIHQLFNVVIHGASFGLVRSVAGVIPRAGKTDFPCASAQSYK